MWRSWWQGTPAYAASARHRIRRGRATSHASSSGIVAKLVDEQGWLGNRETPGMLSLLVAEDLLMALYLPILGVLLLGGAGASMVGQVALAVTAAFLVLGVAIRFGSTISAWLFTEHTEAMLLGAFGTASSGGARSGMASASVAAFAIAGPVLIRVSSAYQSRVK